MCFHDARRPIPPEIVIGRFNVSFWIVEARLITVFFACSFLQLSYFLRSEKLPTGKSGGTLQRRDAVVIPNALQVRMTPCRVRRTPGLIRRRFGDLRR